MASPMLSVVFLLFVLMHGAATCSTPCLEVKPTDLTPGLTDSLTVNCSFSFAGITNMSDIISLILSKTDANISQFLDLVSVNVFSPDNLTILSEVDGSVSGYMDVNGESYISIIWTYPTADKAGVFRCEAHGVDSFGHPMEMYQTTLVASHQPDLDDLTDKVSQLQRQLQRQENLAKNQSDAIDKLSNVAKNQTDEIDKLSNLAKNQSNEIDKLLSVTKTQAEIISAQQSQIDIQAITMNDLQSQLNIVKTDFPFYISSQYNGHYYLLSKENWNNSTVSAKKCEDHGGYLARVNDANESQFVKDFADRHYDTGYDHVLISGTDSEHEGKWTYTGTDTDLVFYDWSSNQPHMDNPWNCIVMYDEYRWKWGDNPCTHSYDHRKFLCELETV